MIIIITVPLCDNNIITVPLCDNIVPLCDNIAVIILCTSIYYLVHFFCPRSG